MIILPVPPQREQVRCVLITPSGVRCETVCTPEPLSLIHISTFYTQFRLTPVGKYLIMLCQGTACHVNSSELILQTIKDELGIEDGETTEDGLFSLKCVACLGCCSLSPVMMINENTYGSLTPEKTKKILKELREAE